MGINDKKNAESTTQATEDKQITHNKKEQKVNNMFTEISPLINWV